MDVVNLNKIFNETGLMKLNQNQHDVSNYLISKQVGYITKIIQHDINYSFIYFLGSNVISWFSEDFGKEIIAVNFGLIIEELILNYNEPRWGLFSTIASIEKDNTTNITNTISINRQVYYTPDFGKSNKLLASHVTQFDW